MEESAALQLFGYPPTAKGVGIVVLVSVLNSQLSLANALKTREGLVMNDDLRTSLEPLGRRSQGCEAGGCSN